MEQIILPSGHTDETLYVQRLKETLALRPSEPGKKFSFTMKLTRDRHGKLMAAVSKHGMTITDLLTPYIDAVTPILEQAVPVDVPGFKRDMRTKPSKAPLTPAVRPQPGKAEQLRLPDENSEESLYVRQIKERLVAIPPERGNKLSFTMRIARARHARWLAAAGRHGITSTDLLTRYIDDVLPILQRARPVSVPVYDRQLKERLQGAVVRRLRAREDAMRDHESAGPRP